MHTVLFDADGVLQRAAPGCFTALGSMLPDGADGEAFLREVFAAERPALVGAKRFEDGLAEVLNRWGAGGRVEEALAAWSAIDVDEEALDFVNALRARGVRCFVASNQNPTRARFMSNELGYGSAFDGELYSCDLGFAKPDPGYFTAAMRMAEVAPREAVFVDDSPANIDAAATVGLRTVKVDSDEPTPAWIARLNSLVNSP